jgi:hypothetical protein
MADRSKGGRRNVDREAVREFYFSDAKVTPKDCAQRFNVSERTIYTLIAKGGWKEEREAAQPAPEEIVEQLEEQLQDAKTQLHVIEGGKTSGRKLQSKRSEVPEVPQVSQPGAAGLDAHVGLVDEMVTVCAEGIRELRSTTFKSLRGKFETIRLATESGRQALEVARTVYGKKPGQPSIESASEDDRGKKYVVVVEPAKTA